MNLVILFFLCILTASFGLRIQSHRNLASVLLRKRFVQRSINTDGSNNIEKIVSLQAGASPGNFRVQHVSNMQEFDALLKKARNQLVVVDFSASWCPPCNMIAPIYDELSLKQEYKSVHFLKVDVDEAGDIAQRYKVNSMPTFLFLKNGVEVGRFSGASREKLVASINELK